MVATLMQSLDSTIANVALPYMQGSMAASQEEINWVLTSYIVAAAIMTAPTGFLAAKFGRTRLFVTAVSGFTAPMTRVYVASDTPRARARARKCSTHWENGCAARAGLQARAAAAATAA